MPFIGEIRMFAGTFNPSGWAFCDGQLLPISENDALFILLGTTYGGDGQENFALPNLQGRLPLHQGSLSGTSFQIGEQGGVESVTLTTNQIPIHTHAMLCQSGAGATSNPLNSVAAFSDLNQYSTQAANTQMGNPPLTSDIAGGSQPHENFMPYLCINFIISLFGEFPHQ
jgi:microcystin-dependent protein